MKEILAMVFALVFSILTVFLCASVFISCSDSENVADDQDDQIVTEGLIGYWSFDRTTITDKTVEDIWGNNDGTINGDPKIVEGKVGEALEFDGIDDFVETTPSATLSLTDAGTLEAWIKGTGTSMEIARIIQTGVDNGIEIGINNAGYGSVSAVLGPWINATSTYTINDDKWYYIAAVFSGAKLSLYVDGELNEEASGVDNLNMQTESRIVIGQHPLASNFFDGLIDEVRVYNRALDEKEILQNFGAKGLTTIK